MPARRPYGLAAFAVITGALLILPGLIVFPMSLSDRRSFVFPPKEWSFRWYENFFSDPGWTETLMNSLQTAVVVAIVATVAGTVAVFGIVRHNFRGKSVVVGLLLAPMVTPIIILGVGEYALFLRWQLVGTGLGFTLAHIVHAIPYVVLTVSGVLMTMDRQLERAAASLGAPPHKVLRTITLPIIAPGIMAGFIFAFISSFDETVIALFLSDPNFRTMPVQMYASMTQEVDPTIAVGASLIMLLSTLLILLSALVFRRRYAKANR
ncbi:ABC transporter permease [Microbispora sp. H11081]|uniref:ABC transporter permease n=1 Tax=Microbispora sp. H11081 TaxID=2729107 RepID=UPI001475874A|nr:ABC transporter permease [Microbispora sp. H11081]